MDGKKMVTEIKADRYRAKRMSKAEREFLRVVNGGLQRFRFARMKQDVKGEFTRWRKGEVVKAARVLPGRGYTIEKVKPAFPWLPVLSQCCAVPGGMLEFIVK